MGTKVYVDSKIKELSSKSNQSISNPNLLASITTKLQHALKTHLDITSIRKDVDIFKRKKHCKEVAIESIQNGFVNVKETLDRSINNSLIFNVTQPSLICPEPVHKERERDLNKLFI